MSASIVKPNLLFVPDDRASRERQLFLNQIIQHLRVPAQVTVMPEGTDEDTVLKKLDELPYDLVLMPWYRYLQWSRVEGFFGFNRTSGRTTAAYFAEPLQVYELEEQTSYQRLILLDYHRLTIEEAVRVTMLVADEKKRCGALPFFSSGMTPKAWNTQWKSTEDLASFFSTLSKLELATECPFLNVTAFKAALIALWDVVFEESGRKALFEIAYTIDQLVVRVIFPKQGYSPKDTLEAYYPNLTRARECLQLVRSLSDLFRVHWIAERGELEVSMAFFASQPGEINPQEMRTFWAEPVIPSMMSETTAQLKVITDVFHQKEKGENDRLVEKMEILRKELVLKDKRIQEMKTGGVGAPVELGLPEAGLLLESFYQRYFEARAKIETLEREILQVQKDGAFASHVDHLKKEWIGLMQEEDLWIKKLAEILKAYRESHAISNDQTS